MRLLFLPALFLLLPGLPAQPEMPPPVVENPWVFKHEKAGIRVFYRDNGSGIYELRLLTKVDASLHAVAALLTDVPSYTKWCYKTSEAWPVRESGSQSTIYYVVSDFPWPLDDRDVVLDSHIKQDPASKALIGESKAIEGQIEPRKNCVRMATTDIRWVCNKTSDGLVDIEYTLRSDPGGQLPNWLVNMAIDFGPVETMKAFKKLVAEPKYRDAKVDFVVD